MRKYLIIVAILFFILGCQSAAEKSDSDTSQPVQTSSESSSSSNEESSTAATSSPAASSAEAVAINSVIPYAKDSYVAANIKNECQLPTQLSDFIKSYGDEYDVEIVQKPSVSETDPGRVLLVEIVEAVSTGNAFIGHRKSTKISGKFYQNGELVGSFHGLRVSGGGAFAGFKGSCSVLGRTVKVLGKDVAQFLKAPVMNANLGDM